MIMKKLHFLHRLLSLTALISLPLAGFAADKKQPSKPYPLDKCVVSDEEFGGEVGEPYVFVHEGREVKLCCKSCLKGFNKETAKHVAKIDAAAKKVKPYQHKTCVVSDEALGEMGEPYVFVSEGQEVKLCCKSCLKDFEKDKKNFLKKAQAKAKSK
jgi:hypothetical protein